MRIVDQFDHFLFDLDGCIYLGDQVISSAPETLAELRRLGKGILFLTNGSFSGRESYAQKLRRMGIAADADEVLTSTWACAGYLKQHHDLVGKTAFVSGSEAFKAEIRAVGLHVVEGEEARRADFVLVGVHSNFSYQEIVLANFAIRNGALFYASNRDVTYPTMEGLMPGTGSVLAAIEAATGQRARTTGKPEPGMIEVACAMLGPGRTLMVGDRLDSDIVGGRRAGVATALVLTGVATCQEVARAELLPDFVLESVGGLLEERTLSSPTSI